MRTAETLVLGPKGLEVERLVAERHKLTFFVGTTGIEAKCPVRGSTHLAGYTAATLAP